MQRRSSQISRPMVPQNHPRSKSIVVVNQIYGENHRHIHLTLSVHFPPSSKSAQLIIRSISIHNIRDIHSDLRKSPATTSSSPHRNPLPSSITLLRSVSPTSQQHPTPYSPHHYYCHHSHVSSPLAPDSPSHTTHNHNHPQTTSSNHFS